MCVWLFSIIGYLSSSYKTVFIWRSYTSSGWFAVICSLRFRKINVSQHLVIVVGNLDL